MPRRLYGGAGAQSVACVKQTPQRGAKKHQVFGPLRGVCVFFFLGIGIVLVAEETDALSTWKRILLVFLSDRG